jgi:hypothetical protein
MDSFWISTVSQLGIYATFVISLIWAIHKGRAYWLPLLGGALYALIFEHYNMLRYVGKQGGYHYHENSWLMLWGDVPLYIPLAWGFILLTSLRLTDKLHLKPWARPFCDALLALLLDLSLDAVAIRLRFWYWHDVGLNDAFFGVPADNFLGWLLVTFTFSLFTRLIFTDRKAGIYGDNAYLPAVALPFVQWGLLPILAYWLYLRLEAIGHFLYRLCGVSNLREQLGVLGLILLFFFGAVLLGRLSPSERKPLPVESLFDRFALILPRVIFHLFGVVGLLFILPETRSLGIIVLAFAVFALEWWITHHADKPVLPVQERAANVRPARLL